MAFCRSRVAFKVGESLMGHGGGVVLAGESGVVGHGRGSVMGWV